MRINRELQQGDRIKCKDAEDAAETGIELGKQGYLWDFDFGYGLTGTIYYVTIQGRERYGDIN